MGGGEGEGEAVREPGMDVDVKISPSSPAGRGEVGRLEMESGMTEGGSVREPRVERDGLSEALPAIAVLLVVTSGENEVKLRLCTADDEVAAVDALSLAAGMRGGDDTSDVAMLASWLELRLVSTGVATRPSFLFANKVFNKFNAWSRIKKLAKK